jgi:hypothetical protein
MKYQYTRPNITVNNWLVNKEDLRRFFVFLEGRNEASKVLFQLRTESGNNRSYDSFEEFENDIKLLRESKEIVSVINLDCSHADENGRGHIWVEIYFSLQTNIFYIIGNDETGKKKDWIDGAYEEMQRICKSFEIEDDEKKIILKKEFGKKYNERVIVEDFNGEKKAEIEKRIKENKNKPVEKLLYNEKHDNLKWYIMAIIAIGGLIIAYVAWQHPKSPEDKNGKEITELDNSKIFKGSIFDLVGQLKSENVRLNRTQMATKNNGLTVKETGYITDLSFSNNVYSAVIKPFATSSDSIFCSFNEKWGKALQSIKIPDKISFEGIINTDFDAIVLKECILK